MLAPVPTCAPVLQKVHVGWLHLRVPSPVHDTNAEGSNGYALAAIMYASLSACSWRFLRLPLTVQVMGHFLDALMSELSESEAQRSGLDLAAQELR